MIVKELLNPESIVVVGASNDITKPGGKILHNLIQGGYDGYLTALNPKETEVQGIKCLNHPSQVERAELAIIAIASKYIPETMTILAREKGTKAFIVLSAGFSEIGPKGKELEDKIVEIVESVGGSLIGPNCIGVLTTRYKGTFAGPVPGLDPAGVDFVTGSGATAAFILEEAITMGMRFSSLFSVGNSAQISVDDVLCHWDETFDPEKSPKVKMIYVEQIGDPKEFLKHTRSLINKGCRIAALKAGTTEAGSRAVSSHTGALAGSDTAVDALFRKAGVIRCHSRGELLRVTAALTFPPLSGKRLAVITHAGGPGVMCTDALSKLGFEVPHISGPDAEELLSKLYHGSSVANPIDFLATGNAEQLAIILDYVDTKFDNIDGSIVIFGTPGMFDVTPVYDVLWDKMNNCKKPIYPVLPSIVEAKEATEHFLSLGGVNIRDESDMAASLGKIFFAPKPAPEPRLPEIDRDTIRKIIKNASAGYLNPDDSHELMKAAGIPCAEQIVAGKIVDAMDAAERVGFPCVMKVVGPVHKTDVGGVELNITSAHAVKTIFDKMMKIEGAEGVLFQQQISGTEIFAGASYESSFGHTILCGLGGIFVEVLKDVSAGLAPLSREESLQMIRSLKGYGIIKGVRGSKGVDEDSFADALVRLSALLDAAPEISEMDINPFMGNEKGVTAVDFRIKI